MDGSMEPTRHKVCMNARCGAITSTAWTQGWQLRSGERANLCTDCGLAYELSRFCEKFHADDPGWRSCNSCGKRLHCGCIASIHSFVLLDTGGVSCRDCAELDQPHNIQSIAGGFYFDHHPDLGRLGKENDDKELKLYNGDRKLKMKNITEEEDLSGVKQEPATAGSLNYLEEMARFAGTTDAAEEMNISQPDAANLNTSLGLGPKSDDTGSGSPFQSGGSGSGGDTKDNTPKYSPVPYRPRHRQVHRQILPRPPTAARPETPETANDSRIARPPGEGKGRNQLLPRYWPRITDQEIQQITSGDSNSVITPLFEKILSASDAGRIGRLVLPKACAEAYFPTISQAEGLPLRINDINGREWQFQFRFWPNNNSRMYVLEGVTPCIQAMRLQAGDTVTFSRLEPEGKLIMGYRKAQDNDGEFVGTPIPKLTGHSSTDYKVAKAKESQSTLSADKRRGRPLGVKSKRLRLESEDSLELKTSWEEAQELLKPPPGVSPTLVTIDGHQFEEYEEPPVLTKKTVTRTKPSGEQDRWVQCDDCLKFRRVPLEAFLHTRWTCIDNVWDLKRANCSAPKELSNEEMDQLMECMTAKNGNQNGSENPSGLDALATAAAIGDEKPASPPPPAPTTKHPRHRPGCTCIVCIQPPSGKGPKHKPTCVCNVCLTVKRRFKTLMMRRKKRQSEREAETARKKKAWEKDDAGASAAEVPKWNCQKSNSENGRGQQRYNTRESATPSPPQQAQPTQAQPQPQPKSSPFTTERGKPFPFSGLLGAPYPPQTTPDENLSNKGHIDLNSQPERDEAQGRMSMMRLLQDASLPLDMYLKQQGMASLVPGASGFAGDQINNAQQQQQQQQQKQDNSPERK